ncbi:ATP-binding protein [Maritimibacter sp. HL-12]|uniref:ATP-binding protein n=1 Tax=Maritimibacter sp. HL-12 TaxID=1162418 RepID=UPI000A0F1FC8|nr:ATP-binding protein [Maritimibacter sp. HL-12]SMH43372.1 serine/threonine-protein kinase RsbW [Maritimibacter sp. HL-12]
MLDRSFGFMGTARDHIVGPSGGEKRYHDVFPGDAHSVRAALKSAMRAFREMEIADEQTGVVEIVLAEVLNNVVEHAYAEHGRGVIELDVRREGHRLNFMIRDDGRPMPGGNTPVGRPHDLDVTADDLPEGGFGWYLIRELTQGLTYRRSGNRNDLRFHIPLSARRHD